MLSFNGSCYNTTEEVNDESKRKYFQIHGIPYQSYPAKLEFSHHVDPSMEEEMK